MREGNVFSLSTPWGVEGGTPAGGHPPRVPPGQDGRYPSQEVPTWGTPRSGWGVPQPGGHPPRVPPCQVRMGGGCIPARGAPTWGTPLPGQDGGVPQPGGTHLGYPLPGQDRGVPQPGSTHPGYPPPGQDEGRGYPSQGRRPPGVFPPPRNSTAHGLLDKRRSVCLLRSRRKTVLFLRPLKMRVTRKPFTQIQATVK